MVTTPEAQQADPDQEIRRWLEERAVDQEVIVAGQNSLTFYARTQARADQRGTLAPDSTSPTNVHTPFGLMGASTPLSRYRTGDVLHLALYWASPPDAEFQVNVAGPDENDTISVAVAPLRDASETIRQLVSIPLTPDLNGGRYRVTINVPGYPPVEAATFTLIQKTAGTLTNPDAIPHTVRYRLGTSIQLIGYALPETRVQPGSSIPLTLYWRTERPLDRRYKVFTHLVGETFNARTETFLWGQQDNEPGEGQPPTTRWAPETIVPDPYRIPVDPKAPPGIYTIEVGMYGLVDGTRLPVYGPEGEIPDRAIRLTTITIQEP